MSREFKLTLLREKFTLRDPASELSGTPPVIALSNRIVLPLCDRVGEEAETFVVRSQNMHSCTRMAAAIAKEYQERGCLMNRPSPFSWPLLWRDVVRGYEKDWNPSIWGAVYYKGRVVFEEGTNRHPFLDIIEQCDITQKGEYSRSVAFAEEAFLKVGRAMKIEHDSSIALILSVRPEEAKSGVILRGATKTTTFNFNVKPMKNGEFVTLSMVLTLSSAFLEGIQLAFDIGIINRKRSAGLVEQFSEEDKRRRKGTERLAKLSLMIETIEGKFSVLYRPDRPDFQDLMHKAEEFAMSFLRPQIEERIASGEYDPDEWVQ